MLNPFIIAGLLFTGIGLLQEVSEEKVTPKLLKGPKGEPGKPGDDGKKGTKGDEGKTGKTGLEGKPSDG